MKDYSVVRKFSGTPRKLPMVSQDRFYPDRWTGVLTFLWTIDEKHPVVIGSGRLKVLRPKLMPILPPKPGPRIKGLKGRRMPTAPRAAASVAEPELIADVARRSGTPVLPGSSIKGAVRQAFELLTPSCEGGSGCGSKPETTSVELCPACSLFGAGGYGGRLSFQEANPVAGMAKLLRIEVPRGWRPRERAAVEGTYRIHGMGKARKQDGEPREKEEEAYSVSGDFQSKVFVTNASEDELGLVFLSLGFGQESGGFRLGGKKYHGMGSVRVGVECACRYFPGMPDEQVSGLQEWAEELYLRARAGAGREEALKRFQEAIGFRRNSS